MLTLATHAATYYVDHEAGSDASPGSSQHRPWQHCPGDKRAGGVASDTKLAPGDTVYFRAGTVYRTKGIRLTGGKSGRPVTYDGNRWGPGPRCLITTTNAPNSTAMSSAHTAHIAVNVFYEDRHNNAHIDIRRKKIRGMTQTVRILNNTIIGWTRPLFVGSGGANLDTLDVRNNLFYRLTSRGSSSCWYFPAMSEIGNLIVDHNVYCSKREPLAKTIVVNNGKHLSLEQWQALGCDRNGAVAEPGLVNIKGPRSTWNARPASTRSPLVNAGADLSAFFTTDKDGNARKGAFDIGAYEYDPRR